MRLIKLMLAASVAVCALASCNKQETTPISKRLRTVEVSLENVIISKAVAADKIKAGDAVVVNDLKIFLTDDAGNEYTANFPLQVFNFVVAPSSSLLANT